MSVLTLTILNGPKAGHKTWLKPRQWVVVGRTDHADFAVESDPLLSSNHFRINYRENRGCELFDLGSKNGTFVNQRRVSFHRLRNADLIVAGNTVFQVNYATACRGHVASQKANERRHMSATFRSPSIEKRVVMRDRVNQPE